MTLNIERLELTQKKKKVMKYIEVKTLLSSILSPIYSFLEYSLENDLAGSFSRLLGIIIQRKPTYNRQFVVFVAQFLSCVQLFVTPWTVACQAPLSRGFSREEYWNGLQFLPPGDLPDPEIEPTCAGFPAWQAGSLLLSHLGSPVGSQGQAYWMILFSQ